MEGNCLETDAYWIRKALTLAASARAKGNHPFGALLVRGGEFLLSAENTVNTENDVTGHAELNLVRSAWQQFGPLALKDCTLYTSTEPCAMCCGAIYWAGIKRVVFGCSAAMLYRLTGGGLHTPAAEILSHGSRQVLVAGPVLEEEALSVHEGFWV